MSRPIDNCAVCVAGGNNLNPHHFLGEKPADATVVGLTVHSSPRCKLDAEGWVKSWLEGKAEFKNGAFRWKSSKNVPPKEIVNFWAMAGYITFAEAEASLKVGKAETDAFLKAYRKNPPKVTAEDRAEMRAAFGAGETVVNIITGKRTKL